MAGLLDLARRLEGKLEKLEQSANTRVINAGIAVLRDLVGVTPVDTSKALSNWQVGLGQRPISAIPAYVTGVKGSTRATSAEQAIAQGTALLRSKKPGQTVYISNLTPYIKELDTGSSRQFAGGFKARARIVARKVAGKGGVGFV